MQVSSPWNFKKNVKWHWVNMEIWKSCQNLPGWFIVVQDSSPRNSKKKSSYDSGSTGKFEIPANIFCKLNKLICCLQVSTNPWFAVHVQNSKKIVNFQMTMGHLGNLYFPPKFIIHFGKNFFVKWHWVFLKKVQLRNLNFPPK